MAAALKDLGVALDEDWENNQFVVEGCGGLFAAKGKARRTMSKTKGTKSSKRALESL